MTTSQKLSFNDLKKVPQPRPPYPFSFRNFRKPQLVPAFAKLSSKKKILRKAYGKSKKLKRKVSFPVPNEFLEYFQAVNSLKNSLGDFHKRIRFEGFYEKFLFQFKSGAELVYPTSADPFHWPVLKSKYAIFVPTVLDPKKIWEDAVFQSHHYFKFLLKSSRFSQEVPGHPRLSSAVLRLFYSLMLKFFYGAAVFHRFTPNDVPPAFFLSFLEQRFVKFFFRPLWDYFDQLLDHEHCYDDSVYGYNYWFHFLGKVVPYFRKSLKETFLFQFVEREHRYWFDFFSQLVDPGRFLNPKGYMELFYPFLQGNPTWTLYLLDRLALILPFFPGYQRRLFLRVGRRLRRYCLAHWQQLQLEERQAPPLTEFDYNLRILRSWFRKQTFYRLNLNRKTLELPALTVIRESIPKITFNSWLPLNYPHLCRLNYTPKIPKTKKMALALRGSRNKNLDSAVSVKELRSNVFLNSPYKVCWSLFLLWFLVFYLKIFRSKTLLFSHNWLNSYCSSDSPLLCLQDSLPSFYSHLLRYSTTEDSMYSLACAYWTRNVGLRQRKILRWRRARRFFLWNYSRRKDSPSTIYRRYSYLREFPFSSFGHYWVLWAKKNQFTPRRSKESSPVRAPLSSTAMHLPLSFLRSAPVYGSRPQVPLLDPTTVKV